ncbi:DUF4286 family protein [Flavicella sp.]|uniref:DUF4286 family protein n=1 Tax=Flavicella sp. TaxID=2957742 RepID=UPI00301AE299
MGISIILPIFGLEKINQNHEMYIYNITTNIEESVENDWLLWMQEIHIPEMLKTGKFLAAKMCKVLVKGDMGGATYSVQYTAETKEALESFYKEDSVDLKNKMNSKYTGKFVFFETEMKLIDKQFSSNN